MMSINREQFQEIFGRAVGMTGKALRQRLNRNLALGGHELTAEQAIVLANLWHREGLCQQEIAEITNRDKTSTTRLIDALEEQKLAVRVPDKTDRRQNMIYLTNEGKERCEKLKQVAETTQNEALRGIDNEHVRICKDVLWKVWRNLSEE